MSRRDIHFLFGQFVPRCTHDVDKHFSDYYVLQYAHGGGVALRIGAATFDLQGRWFWSSYPGPRIAFKPSTAVPSGGAGGGGGPTWVHRYLAFKGPAVEHWVKAGLFPVPPMPAPPTPHHPAGDYSERFDRLLELSRREDPAGHRRASLELELLLCELAEAYAALVRKSGTAPTGVDRAVSPSAAAGGDWLPIARARLEALGPVDLDYEKLAIELGLSARTFRREFARRVGVPPHRYLLSSRISHARELLAHTDLPLKEIARELGYADVFYFSRQFRKHTGVPPGLFRRSREG